MPKQCDLTGKHVQFGNKVSHSNRKSRRRFEPNFRTVVLESKLLRRTFRLQLAVSSLRTVEHKGGLDDYLIKAKAAHLTEFGQKLRRLVKALAPKPEVAANESAQA